MDLSHLLTDRHQICTQAGCGIKPRKPTCENFLTPLQKHLAGKTSNFAHLPPTRRQ